MPKKKYILYILFSIYSVSITIYSFAELSSINKIDKKNKIYTKENNKFIIKTIKNNISVFKKGSTKPFLSISRSPKDLPEYDRQLLKNGININSLEELNKLLEDYED